MANRGFPPKVHLKDTLCPTVHAPKTSVSLVCLSILHPGYTENILNCVCLHLLVTGVREIYPVVQKQEYV